MNKVFIILAVIIGIFFLSQLIMSFQSDKIETPKYTVLKKYDEFEIRQYDSMIIAQTILPSSSYDASSSMGFRRVASYIFGGNNKNESISMTAPVFMEMGENTKMAFVMPLTRRKTNIAQSMVVDWLYFLIKLIKCISKMDCNFLFWGNLNKITKT